MKILFRLFNFSILMVTLAVTLMACSKDSSVDPIDKPGNTTPTDTVPGTTPTDTVNVVMQTVALSGTVRDTNGNPLSGVRVTTGSASAVTGGDGTFSFNTAGTVDDMVIMQLTKSGYFTLTRSCEKDSSLYVEAMLHPQGNSDISLQTTFDASTAKTLQVGGVKIDFPASSIVSADGKTYSGNVHVDALYLQPDTVNTNALLMMPGGDWTGISADNSKGCLIPFGMVNVVLTDNSGNRLNINDKFSVKISFPAPAPASGTNLPATVPLWTFDEAKGLWTEDGSLTLQGNVYSGTVSHFSWFTEEWKYVVGTTHVTYHVTACDDPAVGAIIYGELRSSELISGSDDYNIPVFWAYGVTNSRGEFTTQVPLMTTMWYGDYTVMYKGKSQTDVLSLAGIKNTIRNIQFDDDCPGVITLNLIPGPDKQSFIVGCKPAMPQPLFGERMDPLSFLIANPPGIIENRTCPLPDGQNNYSLGITISSYVGWNTDFTEYTYACRTIDGDKWTGTIYLNSINDACVEYINELAPMTLVKTVIIGQNNPVSLEFLKESDE